MNKFGIVAMKYTIIATAYAFLLPHLRSNFIHITTVSTATINITPNKSDINNVSVIPRTCRAYNGVTVASTSNTYS
ncbi:hypothetical protein ES703_119106 [subsurface metagenome]